MKRADDPGTASGAHSPTSAIVMGMCHCVVASVAAGLATSAVLGGVVLAVLALGG